MYSLHSPNITVWGIGILGHTASSQIVSSSTINTLNPKQNGRYSRADILKLIFFYKTVL